MCAHSAAREGVASAPAGNLARYGGGEGMTHAVGTRCPVCPAGVLEGDRRSPEPVPVCARCGWTPLRLARPRPGLSKSARRRARKRAAAR